MNESGHRGSSAIAGVITVLPTPFDGRGRLDLDSLASLVQHSIAAGSDGLVCFGLASELYKLTDDERTVILRTVLGRSTVVFPSSPARRATASRPPPHARPTTARRESPRSWCCPRRSSNPTSRR